MNKVDILKYANDTKMSLCRNCVQVCKSNNYTPCMERHALDELILFAEKYMSDDGEVLAPSIFDGR